MAKTGGAHAPTWLKLDNAAKIYPPSRTRGWAAMFRLSVTLTEPIDPAVLDQAHRAVLARFPTFRYRLRRGFFWYYLDKMEGAPDLQEDVGNPLVRMDLRENGRFLYRVRHHGRRIAVEFFHALTDGSGGLSFLLTLAAEYLRLKRGARIPAGGHVLSLADRPQAGEMEDSFLVHARGAGRSRLEEPAFHIEGTPERSHFLNITTGIIPSGALKEAAKAHHVSVTGLLVAILLLCFQDIQAARPTRRVRPVKVQLPVNLRRFYGSKTLRNFASYVNVGIQPAYGRHSFEEILTVVRHTLGLEIAEKPLNARMSANVNAERNPVIRATPLFLKAPFLKIMFGLQGDRYCTTTFSNLGEVTLPEEMRGFVTRMDFLLGTPFKNPVICACVSCGGKTYINFSRCIRESFVERAFFTTLVKMGIPVLVESNSR